ncbi:MAG: hypothetical protein ACQETK_07315 [Pseudomonadota bacterium]
MAGPPSLPGNGARVATLAERMDSIFEMLREAHITAASNANANIDVPLFISKFFRIYLCSYILLLQHWLHAADWRQHAEYADFLLLHFPCRRCNT